jgi:hypothetical protein
MCKFGTFAQNTPNNPTENIGNVHGATLTEGENCVNVLNFSTNHDLVEQLIVEPSLDLSLSRGDLLDVSCDKNELCATASSLHASAENKHIMHVASKNDELHLLSSLHTLGYSEFDDLCNLYCLEENFLHMLIFHGCLGIHIMLLANITTRDNIWYIGFTFVQF